MRWLTVALIVVCGCGGTAPKTKDGNMIPRDHPRVALLPLENLSSAAAAGEVATRIFWAELSRSGAVEMVDPGNVDAALESLHIVATASLTSDQLKALADSLGVRYLILGSVLENEKIQTQDGSLPAVGASLRMVDPRSARVVWVAIHFRSGDDRESIFGWGRVKSADRLVTELAAEMLAEFREVGRKAAPQAAAGGIVK